MNPVRASSRSYYCSSPYPSGSSISSSCVYLPGSPRPSRFQCSLCFFCVSLYVSTPRTHHLHCSPLIIADVLQITVSLIMAYYVTNYLARHGYDPDVYAMPIHSAIIDLMGQLMLVSSFELASVLGLHVRSHLRA
jgi:hypothetical protein